MIANTLPSGGYSGPCISVPANATLTIDIPYQFSGTTFNMGANSRIMVAAPNKLTVDNNSVLQGCGALWQGITLAPETLNPLAIPGGQLDMSNSSLLEAEIGILAQNHSKIRLVNNTSLPLLASSPTTSGGAPNQTRSGYLLTAAKDETIAVLKERLRTLDEDNRNLREQLHQLIGKVIDK